MKNDSEKVYNVFKKREFALNCNDDVTNKSVLEYVVLLIC